MTASSPLVLSIVPKADDNADEDMDDLDPDEEAVTVELVVGGDGDDEQTQNSPLLQLLRGSSLHTHSRQNSIAHCMSQPREAEA